MSFPHIRKQQLHKQACIILIFFQKKKKLNKSKRTVE